MRDEALGADRGAGRAGADTYVPPQCYVFIYAGLGEREQALDYQEKAYEDGASPFNYLTPSIRELYALDPAPQEAPGADAPRAVTVECLVGPL